MGDGSASAACDCDGPGDGGTGDSGDGDGSGGSGSAGCGCTLPRDSGGTDIPAPDTSRGACTICGVPDAKEYKKFIDSQPEEVKQAAYKLYDALMAKSHREIVILETSDIPCAITDCGGVPEAIAKRIIDEVDKKQASDETNDVGRQNVAVAAILALIALLSMIIAYLAHRHSKRMATLNNRMVVGARA